MLRPSSFQDQVEALAYGEVHLLLLATDIERQERLGVHVVLISPADDVESSGYSCTNPVFSRYFPMPAGFVISDDDVRRMRKETIVDFATRLRELLSVDS